MPKNQAERTEVHDDSGRLLGLIVKLPDGKRGILDPLGVLRGTYNPENNETRDWSGRYVGVGNKLEKLVGGRPLPTVRVSGRLVRARPNAQANRPPNRLGFSTNRGSR